MIEKFKNKELALKSLAFLIIPAAVFLYQFIIDLVFKIINYSQVETNYNNIFSDSVQFLSIIFNISSFIAVFLTVLLFCCVCFLSNNQKFKKIVLGAYAFFIIINNLIGVFVACVIQIPALQYIEKYPNPVLHTVFAIFMLLFIYAVPFLKAAIAIRAIKGPFKTNKFVMVVAILAVVGCFTGIFSDFLNAVQWASQGYVNFFLKNILVDVVKAVVAGYVNFCFVYFCLGGNEIKLKNVKGDC
ncbi:MAG: hypothetical protein IIW03_02245 [Clostridia bacterium]|nr:hypothetical protein [Clostridia bacterium]